MSKFVSGKIRLKHKGFFSFSWLKLFKNNDVYYIYSISNWTQYNWQLVLQFNNHAFLISTREWTSWLSWIIHTLTFFFINVGGGRLSFSNGTYDCVDYLCSIIRNTSFQPATENCNNRIFFRALMMSLKIKTRITYQTISRVFFINKCIHP